MKKWQTPKDIYNKDADQSVPPHNACLYPTRHVLLILTREFLISVTIFFVKCYNKI